MTNDLTTLSGSLDEMKDQLITELDGKGVTATFDSSTGLLGLVSKIGDIQTSGGGCPQLVTGTFTTGSSSGTATETINYNGSGYPIFTLVEIDGGVYNNGTGGNITWYNSTTLRYYVGHVIITKARTTKTTIDIDYDGDGYPIACMVFIQNGGNNATSGGDSTWYNSTDRYDVGAYYMTKAEINTTPTYTTSGSNNYGFLTLIYKNSTTDPTTLTSSYARASVTYNSSNAGTSTACIRFVGDGTTLGTYVGNKTSTTIGLAPSTTYSYIVIYSE